MELIKPTWPAPANIQAFTTTRHSYQGGSFSELKNQRFQALFDLPTEPIWLQQTHSNIAIEALPQNRNQNADASFASLPQQICVVATADCLPILICNESGTQVAAIHAGWRGLANGIIKKTLQTMKMAQESWYIWLGPAISQKHFEVGQDVFDAFVVTAPETRIAFTPTGDHKWLANLYTIARLQFQSFNLHNIYGGEYCTYSQANLFYSYRRDKGHAGRMATLIWMSNAIS